MMTSDRSGPDYAGPDGQATLDAVLSLPALSDREWAALHGAILDAAGDRLAQRRIRATTLRRPPARVQRRRRWLTAALPLAAAALVLLMIGRPRHDTVTLDPAAQALLADVSDVEFSRLVAGHDDAATLLLIAVQDETRPLP